MSGILAVIGQVRDSRVEAALEPLRYLGGEREQVWSEDDALIVVTRKAWQLDDDFCGNVLVLESPDLVVAADASLFDKKGLARKLSTAGVRARGETASHYLEAAYRAWGADMVGHLNGDYAFVIWDRRERKLFAARDALGWRPLYWTQLADGIAIGSSSRALAELRGGTEDLNLNSLGAQVAGMAWSNGTDTAYRAVDNLQPARRLVWRDGSAQVTTFWQPRAAPDRRPSPAGEAAEELRELLCTAVAQRLSSQITSVWMSGGWDSTAVFGAGQHALPPGDRGSLRPVSISYPAGDPGCEDDWIKQVAAYWGADVHWLESEQLPLLDGLIDRAAASDEPPTHLYELWNRGLAKGTRAVGSRIAFDGGGGDQLFQVSDAFLADLLQSGRWLRLGSLARSRTRNGWRHLARTAVLPLLPGAVVKAAEPLAGRRLPRHYMERTLTRWVRKDFLRERDIRERDLAVLGTVKGSSPAQTEGMLYLGMPVWAWNASFMRGSLLQEGVEFRSPMLDLRVVDFALRRPISERSDGVETKILLRRAMKGLLPDELLAARTHRTGITSAYSRRRMKEAYPALVGRLLGEPLRLADLGIVDPAELRAAAEAYFEGRAPDAVRVNLFHTMKIEFWLRGSELRKRVGRTEHAPDPVTMQIPAA